MRYFLTLLCALLVVAPTRGQAASFHLGTGYIMEKCASAAPASCMEGMRLSLGIEFFTKKESYSEQAFAGADEFTADVGSGVVEAAAKSASSPGELIVGILVGIALFVLIAGLAYTLVALFSQQIDFGIELTYDYLQAQENYATQARGAFMVKLRPFSGWLVLRSGVGPSYRKTFLRDGDEKTNVANQGAYRKFGVGLSPADGQGPFIEGDWEGEFVRLGNPDTITAEQRRFLPDRGESVVYTIGWRYQF